MEMSTNGFPTKRFPEVCDDDVIPSPDMYIVNIGHQGRLGFAVLINPPNDVTSLLHLPVFSLKWTSLHIRQSHPRPPAWQKPQQLWDHRTLSEVRWGCFGYIVGVFLFFEEVRLLTYWHRLPFSHLPHYILISLGWKSHQTHGGALWTGCIHCQRVIHQDQVLCVLSSVCIASWLLVYCLSSQVLKHLAWYGLLDAGVHRFLVI